MVDCMANISGTTTPAYKWGIKCVHTSCQQADVSMKEKLRFWQLEYYLIGLLYKSWERI